MEAGLLRAAHAAGVPVPQVVAAGRPDGLDPGWLVVERLEGEAIPRRILRNDELAAARTGLTRETAAALAAIHSIDPGSVAGLPDADPLRDPRPFLEALDEQRPVLELGARWLELGEATGRGPTVVHGDFRMGNFLVDAHGLRGVLDWELAHRGNPVEDIGWLCARAWRFGGPGRVGGFGELDAFLAAYHAAGGQAAPTDEVRWWEVYASVKWAVICMLQAGTHLRGSTRSVELAAIGRRVCECEWDILGLLGVDTSVAENATGNGAAPTSPPFGSPSAAELVEAVREYIETKVMVSTDGPARFEARVARNVLAMVGRELDLGPAAVAAHHDRLRALGVRSDAALVTAIRAGSYDRDLPEVGTLLAGGVRDQLRVANPSYLRDPAAPGAV